MAAAGHILLAWAVISVVLFGLGALVAGRWLHDITISDLFWAGMSAAILLLQIWHLFFRIGLWAAIFLSACAAAGWGLHARLVPRLVGDLARDKAAVLLLAGFALFTARDAAGPCWHYDTGLYGAPTVHWTETYPIVPGLTNLHPRFGFNCSTFLLFAAMDRGTWHGASQHLLSGLVMVALAGSVFSALCRLVRDPRRSTADWFLATLIVLLLAWLVDAVNGMSTDFPANTLSLAAIAIVFRALVERVPPQRLALAMFLLAATVTLKLSTAVFAAGGWGIAAWMLWTADRSPSTASEVRERRRLFLTGTALSVALIFPWLIRGAVLSGYPLFPSTAISLPVSWRAESAAAFDRDWVLSWARTPMSSPAKTKGTQWIGGWIKRQMHDLPEVQLPLGVLGLGLILIIVGKIRPRFGRESADDQRGGTTRAAWLIFVPVLADVWFWFKLGPDPRYAQFAFWTAAAAALSLGVRRTRFPPLLLRILLLALPAATIWMIGLSNLTARLGPLNPVTWNLPVVRLTTFTTRGGVVLWVPVTGNQAWNAPLPSASSRGPKPPARLWLRTPGKLEDGFMEHP